jgi:Tat protein translocase TatB subunit
VNVFGVGPLELLVILAVALIFVGPERLPRLAADLARTIREIRKYTSGLATEFQEVVKDVERETEGERGLWKEVAEGIGGATQQVTEAVREARQDMFPSANSRSPGSGSPAPASNGAVAAGPPAANGASGKAWVEIPDPDAETAQTTGPASES